MKRTEAPKSSLRGIPVALFRLFLLAASCTACCQAQSGNSAELAQACPRAFHFDIETALTLAVKNSSTLRYGRLERNLEAQRYMLSFRSFLPAVSLSYARNDSVIYYSPDDRSRRVSVGITQQLYAGGSRSNERRLQEAGLHLRERALLDDELALSLQVIGRYIEILKFHLQLAILQESLQNSRVQADIAGQELSLGDITRLDYLQILLAVKDLEIELTRMEQERERLLFELKNLLGIDREIEAVPRGRINPGFSGMLLELEEEVLLSSALRNSLALQRLSSELANRRESLQRARLAWLPAISVQTELSMAGEQFPLTDPGVSFALSLDFRLPAAPVSTTLRAGSSAPGERFIASSTSARAAENLQEIQAVRLARLSLLKAEEELEEFRRELQFSIRQQLQSRAHQLRALQLLQEKCRLNEQRLEIESLMLEVGEITRLEYVQSENDLARQRIEVLSAAVALFDLEASLLQQCGLEGLRSSHRHILIAEAEP